MATLEIPEQTLTKLKVNADARQMPLAAYLESLATADHPKSTGSQLAAIESFTEGTSAWVRSHLPAGHVVNDSRESMYPDRS